MMVRSRTSSIVVALVIGTLVFAAGALSAVALTRGTRAVPNCGTPSVDTIPCIQSGHHDEDVTLNGPTRVGGLRLRAGNWFVIAKVVVRTGGGPLSLACTLTVGAGTDTARVVLPPSQSNTATMTQVQTLTSAGSAVVRCDGNGQVASMLKITAIRAGTLFDQPIS